MKDWIDEPREQAERPPRHTTRTLDKEDVWITSERRGLRILVRPWYLLKTSDGIQYRSPGMWKSSWWRSLRIIWKARKVELIPAARMLQP